MDTEPCPDDRISDMVVYTHEMKDERKRSGERERKTQREKAFTGEI